MRRVMGRFKRKREARFAHIGAAVGLGTAVSETASRIMGVVRAFAPLLARPSSIRPSLLHHSTQPVLNLPRADPGAPDCRC